MATSSKRQARTTKQTRPKSKAECNRIAERLPASKASGNGKAAATKKSVPKIIEIPAMQVREMTIKIVGDRPLLVNNKAAVMVELAKGYSPGGGGGTGPKPPALTREQVYAASLYLLPDSEHPAPDPRGRYGVPTSGIKKCFCAAIAQTGVTNNAVIGKMQKAFSIMEDAGGLCLLQGGKPQHDQRPACLNGVPQERDRGRWDTWFIKLRIKFNPLVFSEETLVNLAMHAGYYIGLCELRAEKKQGECGGFVVDLPKAKK
jgi:hypothetical protein